MRSLLHRLPPVGLRWRLAGWFTVVTLACTAIVFVAVYRGTATQLRHQIDAETSGDARELSHNLLAAGARSARAVSDAARRYIQAQPFKASSTLLFAVVPGAATSTNRPELFAQGTADSGESGPEQLQENRVSRRLLAAPYGYSTLTLPDVGDLRLLKHLVRVRGGLGVTIGVGTPLAPVAHAQRGLARAFVLAGLLALACALLASYVLGARLSRPLRRMAAVAARVDAGDLHPRIHYTRAQRDEVRVLADSFNRMLDRLTEAFAGQRAFVADASHELRTPLTVIRGQLEVLVAHDEPSPAEVRRVERLVQAEIARISRLVDDLLLLAKTEQTEFLRVRLIELAPYVAELWDGASLLAERRFELAEVPRGTLRADPDRLAQALRNLIGNAIEHTRPESGLVRMRVQALPGERLRFLVEDDGPGIPLDQRERVFRRFHRTDTARDRASGGTGLGLAIVRAIADAHGGSVSAGESPEGGARIELELPGFTPAPPGPRPERAQAGAARPHAGAPARVR
jgi:two-component system, OmpR family, sensor kinase